MVTSAFELSTRLEGEPGRVRLCVQRKRAFVVLGKVHSLPRLCIRIMSAQSLTPRSNWIFAPSSPDILPMFAHNVPQMYSHSYHEDSEDFASGTRHGSPPA